MNRFTKLAAVAVFAAGMLAAQEVRGEGVVRVETAEKFYEAVAGYATATGDVVIEVSQSFTLDQNPWILPQATPGRTLTIRSANPTAPVTIKRGVAGHINVSHGATLIIENIIIDGGDIDLEAVLVMVDGSFVMNNGAILRNSVGGAVHVGGSGIFTMNGGKISNNTAYYEGSTGGVSVAGTFTMIGGEISNNIGTADHVGDGGGGVRVNDGTFNLGGTAVISGNTVNGVRSNVFLGYGDYITLGTGTNGNGVAVPVSGMHVGIAGKNGNWYEEGTRGVFVQSGAVAGDQAYFFADEAGKKVLYDRGRLLITSDVPNLPCVTTVSELSSQIGVYANVGENMVIEVCQNLIVDRQTLGLEPWDYRPLPPIPTPMVPGVTLTIRSKNRANPVTILNAGEDYLEPLYVLKNATLILEDITIGGFGDAVVKVVDDGSLVLNNGAVVRDGGFGVQVEKGNLTMNNGSVISDNIHIGISIENGSTFTMNGGRITNTASGPGVIVFSANGTRISTFTMNGGEISGNNNETNGGGVLNGGEFTMTGGKIIGNTAEYRGGGVVNDGVFTMTGGEISGNANTSGNGGGVWNNGVFTMTGGEISGNTTAFDGGGVYNGTGWGTFTMVGGKITNNAAESYGGGVSGEFTMTGGEISGNTASINGGGVRGTGTFGGTAVISGNTVNDTANNVFLEGWFNIGTGENDVAVPAPGMKIGVTKDIDNYGEEILWYAKADHLQYFVSDDARRTIEYDDCNCLGDGMGGILRLVKIQVPVTYSVSASDNGSVSATVDGNDFKSGDKVAAGKSIVFTAEPDAHYEVDKWEVVGVGEVTEGVSGNMLTYEVLKPAEVVVTFRRIVYEVAFSAGENGTLTASVDGKAVRSPALVGSGLEIVFTALPVNSYYGVAGWTKDGAPVNGTDSEYKFAVAGNAVVAVSFGANDVNIADAIAGLITWDVIKGKNDGESGGAALGQGNVRRRLDLVTAVTSPAVIPAGVSPADVAGFEIEWDAVDNGTAGAEIIDLGTGKLKRANADADDGSQVTLTATVKNRGGVAATKSIILTVMGIQDQAEENVDKVVEVLEEELDKLVSGGGSEVLDNIFGDAGGNTGFEVGHDVVVIDGDEVVVVGTLDTEGDVGQITLPGNIGDLLGGSLPDGLDGEEINVEWDVVSDNSVGDCQSPGQGNKNGNGATVCKSKDANGNWVITVTPPKHKNGDDVVTVKVTVAQNGTNGNSPAPPVFQLAGIMALNSQVSFAPAAADPVVFSNEQSFSFVVKAAPLVPVTSVVVASAGNASSINVSGGTLSMTAQLTPSGNAPDYPEVEWSVSPAGIATISKTGPTTALLTATGSGSVTVVATAVNGGNGTPVVGVMTVNITAGSNPITGGNTTPIVGTTPVERHHFTADLSNQAYTGAALPVSVTSMFSDLMGNITVLYNGSAVPPSAIGTYQISVSVSGGTVFAPTTTPLSLGSYNIVRGAITDIADGEKVIPGGDVGEGAIVVPVSGLSAVFTAGPNPVAKASGAVSFFWQGAALAGGTLSVYDAQGNLVKKVSVSDVGSGARRVVGAWDLTDSKGRVVSEGTYLVRGEVKTADGGRERVSYKLGVR